ncbi:nuclear factor interleukin-3-regulated protein-like [Pecten maximus]|uniref:nuclear factor interleukin-3-regulated protein-like n=1 Tax=Pecten maximus TaxID=6579 RepID=UPI001458C0A6|nr:nuclear factor interleukin-3-regulated protein-like [Pecten maximus]XP_033738994.1 nuclear factor interleukin-3-regulated protein-like [Pecten maximus]
MLKDGTSPNAIEPDHAPADNHPDHSNAAGTGTCDPMDEINKFRDAHDGGDSLSELSSDCEYPSQSSSIPTCVVAPTSTDPDEYIPSRKQREFIPENKKDDHYWEKRRKNNDAARRSREKRRYHDLALENRIVDLTRDNCGLRNELYAIKKRFGIPLNEKFVGDDEPSPLHIQRQSDSASPSLVGTGAVGGMSPGNKAMPTGYMQMGTGRGSIPVSVPPPLLHIGGGMPVGMNFGANGPMSMYVGVSTSDDVPAGNTHHVTSTYRESEDQEDQPPPAHSQHVKREVDQDVVYGSDIPSYYQRGPESPSTSLHQSATMYSRNTAPATSLPIKKTMDYSDDNSTQEEPLSLTVNKSYGVSGNESSNSTSSSESMLSQSPPATALPHKLRHKSPGDYSSFAQSPSQYGPFPHSSSFGNPLINGLAQLSEIALAQSGPLPLLKTSSSGRKSGHKHNPRSHIDPKYAERRKRNNEAARKCRENRKSLTMVREAKSEYLAGENGKLRDELDDLQDEMRKLKELIEKKRVKGNNSQEKSDGDSF